MSSKTKVFAFFRISSVKFSNSIPDPVFVRFYRKGHHKWTHETIYQIQDTQNIAVFNTEFSVPLTLERSDKGKNSRKIAYAQVGTKRAKKNSGEKRYLGKWKFDLANFDSPSSKDDRTSTCFLQDGTTATLNFNVVIVKQKDYDNGKPASFFTDSAVTTFQSVPVDQHEPITETEAGDESPLSVVKIEEKKDETFQIHKQPISDIEPPSAFQAPPNADNPENNNSSCDDDAAFNSTCDGNNDGSPEDVALYQLRKIYLHTLDEHKTTLEFIAYKQCLIKLSITAYKTLAHPKFRSSDYSDELILPIREFHVFEISNLSIDLFNKLMVPVHKAIQSTLAIPHCFADLIAIFATILFFGLKIAYEGIPYTTVYNDSLTEFEEYLDRISFLIIQNLVAALASTIDISRLESADSNSILSAQNEIFLYLQMMRQMKIPNCVIQQIQVNCCRSIDVLLFNSMADSKDIITGKNIQTLSNKIRVIQSIYQCQSDQMIVAFEQILYFIRTAESLIDGIEISRIGPPNPLHRSIADRCDPPIKLPGKLTIERLGPEVKDTSTLRLPNHTNNFKFTYDWLILKEPSLFKP